eukprot:Opistho-1_new@19536
MRPMTSSTVALPSATSLRGFESSANGKKISSATVRAIPTCPSPPNCAYSWYGVVVTFCVLPRSISDSFDGCVDALGAAMASRVNAAGFACGCAPTPTASFSLNTTTLWSGPFCSFVSVRSDPRAACEKLFDGLSIMSYDCGMDGGELDGELASLSSTEFESELLAVCGCEPPPPPPRPLLLGNATGPWSVITSSDMPESSYIVHAYWSCRTMNAGSSINAISPTRGCVPPSAARVCRRVMRTPRCGMPCSAPRHEPRVFDTRRPQTRLSAPTAHRECGVARTMPIPNEKKANTTKPMPLSLPREERERVREDASDPCTLR